MAHEYADVDDLKDRLGVPDDDGREATLAQAVTTASRWVEHQLGGRHFYATTATRYYSPHWHYPYSAYGFASGGYPWGNPERPGGGGYADMRIIVDDILSVTAVATDEDNDGVYETTWTVGTDYWVGPRNAPAEGKPYKTINRNINNGRRIFPPWEESVAVTGSYGYSTTVPDEIRDLTLYVAQLFSREVMEFAIPGVDSYQLGTDLKVDWRGYDLPLPYRRIIEQYRDGPFGV